MVIFSQSMMNIGMLKQNGHGKEKVMMDTWDYYLGILMLTIGILWNIMKTNYN